MKNLSQFRNKSHEEVRQYILKKKGVGIGSNVTDYGRNGLFVWPNPCDMNQLNLLKFVEGKNYF